MLAKRNRIMIKVMFTLLCTSTLAWAYPQVTNGSFEMDTFTVYPGYADWNGGVITGWSYTGMTGLNPCAGNPFANNGAIPNGINAGFIQNTGSLNQNVAGFQAGVTYSLTYYENAAAGYENPTLQVQLGSQILVPAHPVIPVGNLWDMTPSYRKICVQFTVPADGSYLLSLSMNPGTNCVVLIDHIRIDEVTAPRVVNGSFEADTYSYFPGYAGGNGGVITGWDYTGSAGLNPAPAGLPPSQSMPMADNGCVPDGSNVAFIETAGSISQTISGFRAGVTYALSFQENCRAGYTYPTLEVRLGTQILVPDHIVWPVQTPNVRIWPYRHIHTKFTVPVDGAYTLSFQVNTPVSGSVVFDDVRIETVDTPIVYNGSFEENAFTVYPGYAGPNGPINGWSSLGAGLNPAAGNPFADNGLVPDGSNVGFIQHAGYLKQTIPNLLAGVLYRLTYYENSRACTANPTLEVRLGSQILIPFYTVTPVQASGVFTQPYRKKTVDFTVSTDGAYELAFIGGNSADCAVLLDKVTITEALEEDLNRGHYLLLEKGVQIQAWTFGGLNRANFLASNFTSPFLFATYDSPPMPGLPGIPWGRVLDDGNPHDDFRSWEIPFTPQLINAQIADDHLDIRNASTRIYAGDWMNYVKANYPHAIVHTDQKREYMGYDTVRLFKIEADPDMLMFNWYPFNGESIQSDADVRDWYQFLQKYMVLGREGRYADGNKPIPTALYIQTIKGDGHTLSQSELFLNQFAAWTFGYKFLCGFLYTDGGGCDSFVFSGSDDSTPTSKFYEVAEVTRQSRNIGPALLRLQIQDLRVILGWNRDNSWGTRERNPRPADILDWVSGWATPYLVGMSVTNLGSKNSGEPGDVFIGAFKPLHEFFDGPSYYEQLYFMVLNGLATPDGNTTQCRQRIRLNFNFASSGITSLQRIRRSDGEIETVNFVSDGGSLYHLDLELDGGTGDLFKYNTGAPFVGAGDGL